MSANREPRPSLAPLALAAAALCLACDGSRAPKREAGDAGAARVRVEVVSPGEVRLLPAAAQLPRCLVFTASDAGVVRLLTMNESGVAERCPPNEPIGGKTFRIPKQEGHVRVIVVFADQPVESRAIASEVRERAAHGRPVTGMDLRAPGNVAVGTLDFTP